MKKLKILIFLIPLFFLTGCDANYTLTITEDSMIESADFLIDDTSKNRETFKEYMDMKYSSYYDMDTRKTHYYKQSKIEKNNKIGMNLTYEYANDNLQSFNMSLILVYDQEYLYASFGGYAQFHTNFVMKDGAERMYIWEPGLAYDFGARIFKKSHIWNLGLQVTNIRHFLVERSYSPNFIFNGNYRIRGEGDDHLNLMFEAGFQPSGILHIVTNYYSFFFNVGVTCKI